MFQGFSGYFVKLKKFKLSLASFCTKALCPPNDIAGGVAYFLPHSVFNFRIEFRKIHRRRDSVSDSISVVDEGLYKVGIPKCVEKPH